MPGPGGRRTPVLLAAAGATWEAAALRLLDQAADLTVQQRAVDVQDLLAGAATGFARCAVVADELSGLDADTVAGLRRHGVPVVAVLSGPGAARTGERLERIGVARCVPADLSGMVAALREVAGGADETAGPSGSGATTTRGTTDPVERQGTRTTVVWGPAGAPGRTTVATSVAAELARRGCRTLLVDADPYGGAVGQHLGILDEVSGLLAVARQAGSGRLNAAALNGSARSVAGGLRVLTGLPRADRWAEVRPAAFEAVLGTAGELVDHVVVDVGFSLEDAPADAFVAAPRRNETTLAALDRADDVVVVGSADPVGLSRLARGLVDLRERLPAAPVHVVVNRTRATLGWSRPEVGAMIESLVGPVQVHFWPDDRESADRALVSGRSLVELGDSPLRREVRALTDALVGERRPRRRLGRRPAQPPKSRNRPPTV